MTTIKSYTDIEQSHKLVKILPLESADMWYSHYGNSKYNPTIAYEGQQWFLCQIRNSLHDDIPCWSLTALLNILDFPCLTQTNENEWEVNVLGHYDDSYIEKTASNPIDACVEMILKLHNLNLL